MFDIGLSELLLIFVVGVLVLKPKDMSSLITYARKLYIKVHMWKNDLSSFLDEIEGRKVTKDKSKPAGLVLKESDIENNHIRMIRGNDGKWYESYHTDNEINHIDDTSGSSQSGNVVENIEHDKEHNKKD